jgi:anti-sigma factor RsiW
MTMTCTEIKEVTVPYLELDLEPSRVHDVTAHLDTCSACRAEMEAVRQVLVRLKGIAVPDPGDRFWREFPGKVRKELAHERLPIPAQQWKWIAGWPMALAASVLLLVGAWFLRGVFDQGPAPTPAGQSVAQAPKTRAGQPPAAEPELPQIAEADWQAYWDDDPDLVLVEMASRLDRRTVDRLFGDI